MLTRRRFFALGGAAIATAAVAPILPKALGESAPVQAVTSGPGLTLAQEEMIFKLMQTLEGRNKLDSSLERALNRRLDIRRRELGIPVSQVIETTGMHGAIVGEVVFHEDELRTKNFHALRDRFNFAKDAIIEAETCLTWVRSEYYVPLPLKLTRYDDSETRLFTWQLTHEYVFSGTARTRLLTA